MQMPQGPHVRSSVPTAGQRPSEREGLPLWSSQGRSRADEKVGPSSRPRTSEVYCCLRWVQSSALPSLWTTAASPPPQTQWLKATHTLTPSTISQECGCGLAQATGQVSWDTASKVPVMAAAMQRFCGDKGYAPTLPWPVHQVLAIISSGLRTGLPSNIGLASPGYG